MLSAKRLREHAGLFAALLGVVALVSGLSVGVVGFLAQSANDGVRAGMATRAGADLALRASLALDADAAQQDAEVRAAIDRSMQGLPFDVDRTVAARVDIHPILDGVSQPSRRASVLSITDLPDRATLVDGAWPTSPDEVSIQADAAQILEITAGDHLVLDDLDVTVTGTWRVNDHLDPRWMGEAQFTEGVDGPDFGPIVIDESVWSQLDTDPRARWTLVPRGFTLTASDLVTVVTAWNSLGSDWRGQVSSQLITLEKQGRFKRTALELGTRVDGLQAIQPVTLLLLAAIALVALAELGRLLTTTRSTEIALLWSRGASALDIGRTTAVEVTLAAAAGAALGTGTALGLLTWWLGPEAAGTVGSAVWAFPLALTIGTVLVVAGSAFRSARRQTVSDPSEAAGRARRLAGPGVVVLATAAAGLSVWQLRLYGSPLTPTPDGGTDVDPIAVVAPALTLIAVVLLALLLFPRVAALDELATKRAGIARILAARTVARRLQLVAAPIVVVAVACATLVIASAYSTTWSDSFQRTSELRAGGALHISVRSPGVDSDTIDAIGAVTTVDGVAPIDLQTLQLGGETGSIVAVTPAAVAQVATAASGSFDRTAAAAAMTIALPGPTLPDDATQLTLATAQEGFGETPRLVVQIMDGFGVIRSVELGDAVDSGPDPDLAMPEIAFRTITYTGDLPPSLLAAPRPLHLMTFDQQISRDAVTGGNSARFVLTSLTATTGGGSVPVELDKYWLPETPILQLEVPQPGYNGLGYTTGADSLIVRMTPSFDLQMSDRATPPAIISQRLADQYDLGVGDTVSFALEDAYERTNASVAMVVPAIPGADLETAVMIDLGYVLHQRLRVQTEPEGTRELWVATNAPDAVAAALRPDLPANTRMLTSGDPTGRTVLGSAATALWLGALGCLLLALIAVVAVVRAQLRSRRLDVVVLRAIGLSSRGQAAVRRRELVLVLGYGTVTGLLAGLAVSALTVPQLARAAVVEPYSTVPTPLGFDLVGLLIGLTVLLAALIVIVEVYTSRVAAQARTAIGAEEVR